MDRAGARWLSAPPRRRLALAQRARVAACWLAPLFIRTDDPSRDGARGEAAGILAKLLPSALRVDAARLGGAIEAGPPAQEQNVAGGGRRVGSLMDDRGPAEGEPAKVTELAGPWPSGGGAGAGDTICGSFNEKVRYGAPKT